MAAQAAVLGYAQSEIELRTARDSKQFNVASMSLSHIAIHVCRPMKHVMQMQYLSNTFSQVANLHIICKHEFALQLSTCLIFFCDLLTRQANHIQTRMSVVRTGDVFWT